MLTSWVSKVGPGSVWGQDAFWGDVCGERRKGWAAGRAGRPRKLLPFHQDAQKLSPEGRGDPSSWSGRKVASLGGGCGGGRGEGQGRVGP